MRFFFSVLFIFFITGAFSQVFVQLELFNDPNTRKYAVGDQITFRTNYSDGEWYKGRIDQILIEEKTLVLNNNIVSLDDVTHFMLYRNSVKYVGGLTQTFGAIWLIQGTIATIFTENTRIGSVLSIGGGSFLGGWLFRKLFYKIPVKLGEQNRLRIVDLRFFVPNQGGS